MTHTKTNLFGGILVVFAAMSALADAPAASAAEAGAASGGEVAAVSHPGNPSIPPYSRYAVILSRRPFGAAGDAAPAAPSPAADPTAEELVVAQQEQALSKQIDLVAVNVTPRGETAVGLVEKGGKSPHNYYLKVGESAGGYTVVGADIKEETATIEKDGVTITLKLGKGMLPKEQANGTNTPAMPPAAATPRPQLASPPPALHRPGRVFTETRPPAGEPDKGKSYVELRRERLAARAAERKAQAEEASRIREEAMKAANEAAAKREREINLNLVKRGQQPLSPIELTPEEDAALEKAGVFDRPAAQEAAPQEAQPQETAPQAQEDPPPGEAM